MDIEIQTLIARLLAHRHIAREDRLARRALTDEPFRAELDLRLDGVKLQRFQVPEGNNRPQVAGVTISGPYNVTGPGDTPSRARI